MRPPDTSGEVARMGVGLGAIRAVHGLISSTCCGCVLVGAEGAPVVTAPVPLVTLTLATVPMGKTAASLHELQHGQI